MSLFRRRAKRDGQPAVWLVQLRAGLAAQQRRLADYLSRKTQYWNRGSWIIALVVFCLLFGACCLLLCIKAFIHF